MRNAEQTFKEPGDRNAYDEHDRIRTTIMISRGAAARLRDIGGALNRGIELASYAASVDALIEAQKQDRATQTNGSATGTRTTWTPPKTGAGQGVQPHRAPKPMTEAQILTNPARYLAERERSDRQDWMAAGFPAEFVDAASNDQKHEMADCVAWDARHPGEDMRMNDLRIRIATGREVGNAPSGRVAAAYSPPVLTPEEEAARVAADEAEALWWRNEVARLDTLPQHEAPEPRRGLSQRLKNIISRQYHCTECGELQHDTPEGMTCDNGHLNAPAQEFAL